MQKFMEPVFEIPYLIDVVTLGILILRMARGGRQYTLFGAMAVVLGCGDAFHLVPRMYALWFGGTAAHSASLGFGKLVTSVTMTVFYVMLYHVWQARYKKNTTSALTAAVYITAAARVALCLFPQNRWFSADSPLYWGIYRNIPFAALGIIIICLYMREAKRCGDNEFKHMWLAITLSFAFYIPVVVGADAVPALGMLMIPKTCTYVWIVFMGYKSAKRNTKID